MVRVCGYFHVTGYLKEEEEEDHGGEERVATESDFPVVFCYRTTNSRSSSSSRRRADHRERNIAQSEIDKKSEEWSGICSVFDACMKIKKESLNQNHHPSLTRGMRWLDG